MGTRRAPPLRDFAHSLPMELLRAREAAMSRFRPMLREHGLTEHQWRVIRALAEYGRMVAGELAQRCFLLAPSLTRILQHLETEKLIRRASDRNDQRRSVFTLTARGRKLFARVAPDSEALYADMAAQFGARNMDQLYALLARFQEALSDR